MNNINKYISIGLLSLTVVSVELIWTRIFSAEFFYTFAFLVLSMAVMGLGAGALALRLFPIFSKSKNTGIYLSLTGIFSLISPPLVFAVGIDFTKLIGEPSMIFRLLVIILLLGSTYFFAGIALARLFKENHQDMPNLYMADMTGAGIGAVAAIIAMNLFETPVAAAFSGLPALIAAFIIGTKRQKVLPVLVLAAMFILSFYSKDLLEIKDNPLFETKGKPSPKVLYRHWDAMAKIRVRYYDANYRGIQIDNAAGTTVVGFDGNYNRPDSMKFDFGINVDYIVRRYPGCVFLSVGAGGGMDVLQALIGGAKEIHAVEVNSHINEMLKDGCLTKFSGNIYNDSRVKVITEDARAYIRRYINKFDFIFSRSANTYAALASGAFALAENYLFTTEAFEDYLNSLTDRGVLMVEHQAYIPRLATEALDALNSMKIRYPKLHLAVYNLPEWHRQIILMSKTPLDKDLIRYAFGDLDTANPRIINLAYPPVKGRTKNPIAKIIDIGWETLQDEYPIDISPCTDDRPFAAQLGLWKNFNWKGLSNIRPYEFYGFPLSKLLIVLIILILIIIVLPLNLLPYLKKGGNKLGAAPFIYFFLIGAAFMAVEVILIQQFTLFIGPPVYSLVTVLLALLIGSGIGSSYSGKVGSKPVFFGIAVWIILDILVFRQLFYVLGSLELIPRIFISSALILPLGFLMGMPFPKGAARCGELIDWGFSVNGTASVLGSAAIMPAAFSFGYSISLLVGAALYVIAYFFLNSRKGWTF
ncbi:MAG: hypothetical protein QG635_2233 [Bacteroidota bacterium]|nr:hypothetical protein [Bacteroidota bacterium]